LPMSEVETAYYLRMQAEDKPGVLAEVTRFLAERGISIEAILQKEAKNSEPTKVIMLTHRVKEKEMLAAIENIEAMPAIQGQVVKIRLEHLNND